MGDRFVLAQWHFILLLSDKSFSAEEEVLI